MDAKGFGEGLANGHTRIERGVGILKDDSEFAAVAGKGGGAELAVVDWGAVKGIVGDLAGRGLDEAQEHAGNGAFAGAGFTDEAEGFATADCEGDVVNDAGKTVGFAEVLGLEEIWGRWGLVLHWGSLSLEGSGLGNSKGKPRFPSGMTTRKAKAKATAKATATAGLSTTRPIKLYATTQTSKERSFGTRFAPVEMTVFGAGGRKADSLRE